MTGNLPPFAFMGNNEVYREWRTGDHLDDYVRFRAPSGAPISLDGPTAGDSAWARRMAAALLEAAEHAERLGR